MAIAMPSPTFQPAGRSEPFRAGSAAPRASASCARSKHWSSP
ncbi:Uncharacterised protein [Mycobacteroides abscessus subsp. abscessus]|nr:Uncharacterised protein [Mycobacteroides abscessus subsp. abscessus]